MSGSSNKPLVF